MSPKISVIIPCFNQAAFLSKAIASLQAQTMPEWECLVVDDGSTDNSAEVVLNLALKDSRIRLIQKINGGSASARDLGLQHAKGAYIQFLDADDTIAPQKLELQMKQMEAEKLDISYTSFRMENSKGEYSPTRSVRLSLNKILIHWGLEASVPIHSFLYRTAFIRKHELSFQSECRCREDWRWHFLCFSTQPKAGWLDYCGANYYQNEEGKTGSYIRMQEGNFEFLAYMAHSMKGWNRIRWAFRISEELWIWLLRMVKYRSTAIAKSVLQLDNMWLIAAMLLMPLSFWWVVVYFIKIYLLK